MVEISFTHKCEKSWFQKAFDLRYVFSVAINVFLWGCG